MVSPIILSSQLRHLIISMQLSLAVPELRFGRNRGAYRLLIATWKFASPDSIIPASRIVVLMVGFRADRESNYVRR